MRHLMFLFVSCVLLTVGCGQIDMVVDVAPGPDAGLPMGDGGPTVGDAGMPGLTDTTEDAGTTVPTEDASVVGDDSGDAAVVPSGDAGVTPVGSCGNGALDPGEVCDPAFLVPNGDGGVMPVVNSGALARCPAADCSVVACPGGGAVVRNQYCVYRNTAPSDALPLSWVDVAERNAQVAAIRTLFMSGTTSLGGMVGLRRYGYTPSTPGTYYWSAPYWSTMRVPADRSSFPTWTDRFDGPGDYALMTVTATGVTFTREPGTAGSQFYMAFPPNAR